MDSSLRSRPPALSWSRPLRSSVQPPFHCSWSSYRFGYPVPGLVSTLLKYTYSVPGRLVQTCLHVTEQVWQAMHLSRFITIAICAMILIGGSPLNLLRTTADHRDLVSLIAGRPVVVEAVRQLCITADHVRGFH